MVDGCTKEISIQQAVEGLTNIAAFNMYAKEIMRVARPGLFLNSCAAHTINMMLEDIEKLPKYKVLLGKQVLSLSQFISHHRTHALM